MRDCEAQLKQLALFQVKHTVIGSELYLIIARVLTPLLGLIQHFKAQPAASSTHLSGMSLLCVLKFLYCF